MHWAHGRLAYKLLGRKTIENAQCCALGLGKGYQLIPDRMNLKSEFSSDSQKTQECLYCKSSGANASFKRVLAAQQEWFLAKHTSDRKYFWLSTLTGCISISLCEQTVL